MSNQVTVDRREIEEAKTWLVRQSALLQQGLQEAETRLAKVIAAAYCTPESDVKFTPYWGEYNMSAKNAMQGLEGVGRFLSSFAQGMEKEASPADRPAD
ncbi:hypothetical protein [Streptomyces sp. TRM75561]|uniref:hypothetical protein n=1 Tax=Streptomyces sp. TRM75561 TaxID=2975269 RepID=UPI00244AE774|nr:hypothetical protein [Streptomyces sp. TRM75561]MDH3039333.1 hypothetical protein [Streptomyces sp. TRM75561]